jgi:threonyl-tRNA synthetase
MALGKREKESQTVSIRRIGSDKTTSMSLKDALKALTEENSIPN